MYDLDVSADKTCIVLGCQCAWMPMSTLGCQCRQNMYCAQLPSRCITWLSVLIESVLCPVAFKMYDLDGDDKISRDELLAVLHMMVGANISEEQVENTLYLQLYHEKGSSFSLRD